MQAQYKILYYDDIIGDMTTFITYWRDKALEFAKDKKFVSITLNY